MLKFKVLRSQGKSCAKAAGEHLCLKSNKCGSCFVFFNICDTTIMFNDVDCLIVSKTEAGNRFLCMS